MASDIDGTIKEIERYLREQKKSTALNFDEKIKDAQERFRRGIEYRVGE